MTDKATRTVAQDNDGQYILEVTDLKKYFPIKDGLLQRVDRKSVV